MRVFDENGDANGWSERAWFELRVPMPPKWALGLWISRYRYDTSAICLEIAGTFRKKGIPCDVIHPDLTWETPEYPTKKWVKWDTLGDMKWNEKDYPRPRDFLKELHKMGFKFCPIDHHQLRKEGPYTEEALKRGLTTKDEDGGPHWQRCWSGGGYIIDFTTEEGRRYFEDVVLKPLYDDGIDVFKVDNAWWRDTDGGIPANGEPPMALQHLLARSHYEARRRFTGERGLAYCHDYNNHAMYPAWWTGDIRSTWGVLEQQVGQIIRNSLTGQLCTSSDIGGFSGECEPELYARWFSWGMLCPICRPHGAKADREPWQFGSEVEDICRRYARLRYRLLPYIYTYIYKHHRDGISELVMPIEKAFPQDPAAREGWKVEDITARGGNDPFNDTGAFDQARQSKPVRYLRQYMFGNELMVAPVTRKGARGRLVYLPGGTDWIDFWSGKRYEGGKTIRRKASLDVVPIFVRSGSIIPMGPDIDYIDAGRPLNPLYLEVYPPTGEKVAEFELYEDDGISEEYLQDKCAITRLACKRVSEGFIVESSGAEGRYRGMPAARECCVRVRVAAPPSIVLLNGKEVPVSGNGGVSQAPCWRHLEDRAIVEIRFSASLVEKWQVLVSKALP